MTRNKETVRKYIAGFNQGDHAQILSCLTDDVEWNMPGWFSLSGKPAFDRAIENEAFTGNPLVTITRVTEENDVVVAEGTVRVAWKAGGYLNAVFCDVFEMESGRIRRLTTYQVNLTEIAKDSTTAFQHSFE
jgi:ketosteroid isomerase-like protein